METLTVFGVEIFSAGKWNGDTYSEDDLDAMVAAHRDLKSRLSPPVKLGHNDDQKLLAKDGLPAAGWVVNLYREGKKLLADIAGIPKKIADLMRVGAFRKRSAEIWWDYEDPSTGKKYPRVLCGLALLGADLPAVNTLDDILALYGGKKSPNLKAYIGDLEIHVPAFELDDEHAYAIGGSRSLPLAPAGRSWDGAAAAKRIFEWAGGDDFSPAKARRGFVYHDASAPEERGSYKLPFADVIDGKLMAVRSGCMAAMASVHGARGGAKMSANEKRSAHSFLSSYYKKFGDEPPEMMMSDSRNEYDDQRFKLEKTNDAVAFKEGGGDEEMACMDCRMYRGKWMMECAVVEGVVRPNDTCKLHQAMDTMIMSAKPAAAEAAHSLEDKEMPEKDKEPQRKDAAADEAKLREQIREEEREKARKEYDEDRTKREKENAEMQTRLAAIEEERERDEAIQTVKGMSTVDNMRIVPALVPLATYLLHQIGKPQPKKYAEKEGAAPIGIRDAFLRFLAGLPNIREFGLFDERTEAIPIDGKDDVWTVDREMKDPETAVQRRVTAYKKDHPEASDEEAMDVIEKGSAEGKALMRRYFGHAGRR